MPIFVSHLVGSGLGLLLGCLLGIPPLERAEADPPTPEEQYEALLNKYEEDFQAFRQAELERSPEFKMSGMSKRCL